MPDLNFAVDSAVISAIMVASLDCIVVANQFGHIIEFNPAAEKTFGYRRDQVLNLSLADLIIPPIYRELHARGMEHYLRTGEGPVLNKRIEITAMRADHSEFPVELTIVPTQIAEQQIFVSFIRDITDRKQNEKKLLSTSARLQRLVENLRGGVLLENETRHIELANQAFCNMFGLPVTPEQLINVDCSRSAEESKMLFSNPDSFVSRVEEILQEQQVVLDDVLHLQDDRVLSRDYVPIFNNEEYMGHLWHYRDVTEDFRARQRSERLLRLEELNREIIRLFLQSDNVDEALNQTLDLTGEILDVSRVYVFHFRNNERLLDNTHEWCALGINPEINNLKGLPFDELVPSFFPILAEKGIIAPQHIRDLPADIQAILEPQNIQSVLILPLYSDAGIEGFIGYDETRHPRTWLPEEITTVRIIAESYARALERHYAQQVLIDARDSALRTAQLRAQFVANMSHEIRTPMTGIIGMLELLRETELHEDQIMFANEAFNSTFRLLNIINDILDFSKLDAGHVILEAENIDLRSIATEVKMTLSPQIDSKPLSMLVDVAPNVPHAVLADSTRLRQVLMNLVSNAIKFTAQGQVVIRIYPLTTLTDQAVIRFEVSDTGIGISTEHRESIFESFVQVDGTTTRKYGGTGLGLAICKQLVELMGGKLEVTSTPKKGSTFYFSLNLPVTAQSPREELDKSDFSNLRALVIDPEKTARYVLTQQLQNWGLQVSVVDDNHSLITVINSGIANKPFDVVFLRRKMLEHVNDSVLETLVQSRMQGYLKKIAVVIDETLPEEIHDTTAVYLQRPIRQSDLYNLLISIHSGHAINTNAQEQAHKKFSQVSTGGRVLLAEDYPLNVDLVKRTLEDVGIQVDAVGDGAAVLEELENQSYDLVLMDMQMPVMDGKETIQHIRASQTAYRHIPILALTASVMKDEQDVYLALGVNGIISKPFLIENLRKTVQKWLSVSQSAKSDNER